MKQYSTSEYLEQKIEDWEQTLKQLENSGNQYRYLLNGHASKILSRGCAGFIQKHFSIRDIAVELRKIFDAQPDN